MENFQDIEIGKIKLIENSRIRDSDDEMPMLMESIRQNGLINPIEVYKEGNDFILVDGNRRVEACSKLGYKKILAKVLDKKLAMDEFLARNTAENIHRRNLSPIEFARVCKLLLDLGLNLSEISTRLNVSKYRIQNALQLDSKVPDKFRDYIRYTPNTRNKKGKLSAAVTGAIAFLSSRLPKNFPIERLYEEARKKELSTHDIHVLKLLLDSGMNFDEALSKRTEYKEVSIHLPFKISEMEKYNKPITAIVRNIIKGTEAPNKKLLY